MELNKQISANEYFLKCPICYETFDNTNLIPKLLPCGHTICARCIGHIKNSCKDSPDTSYISFNSGFSADSDKSEKPKKEKKERDNYSGEDDEENEEESDEDEEEEEEESEEESISYADIIDETNQNLQNNNNTEEKHKIKCSICRKKYKLFLEKLLDNQQVLNYLELFNLKHQLEDKTNSEDDNLYIFCSICKKTDISKNHKKLFPNHESNHFKILKDFKLFKSTVKSLDTLENTRKCDCGFSIKKYLDLNFDVLFKLRKELSLNIKEYLKNYSLIYDKNLPNSSHHDLKIHKLEGKVQLNLEDKKYLICIKKLELLKKAVYEDFVYVHNKCLILKNLVLSNNMFSLVKRTFDKIVSKSFISINKSIFNETCKYEKRFHLIPFNYEYIIIYDLSTRKETKLFYEEIFEESKSYTKNIEIDETGERLLLLGDKAICKKFRIFDLQKKI